MSEIKAKRNGSAAAEDQRMEKVKEILFGHELRIVEDRMAANQAQFEAQLAQMKKAADAKIRALEAQLKRQHDDFAKDLAKSEAASAANLTRTNNEDSKLAERLEKMRASQKEDVRDLKALLSEQTKSLGNSIKASTKQLDTRITTEIETVRSSHVDRATLAELFESFAASLEAE